MSRPATTYRIRKNFGRIKKIVEIPNLVDIQMRSYDEFLQAATPADERRDVGLQTVFKSVFPIKDFNEVSSLEFIGYSLEKPKYDVDECRSRGMTYAAPLKVTIRLVVWDVDEETNVRSIRDVKEQEVYFGEIPLMTENGTFIINGTERVVVSQLHRSPGVFFDHDKGKTHSSGKLLYSARVIPYRGSWLDMEFDHKDILYVRIDRRRKMPVTVLLRALGYSSEQMLNFFYQAETITIDKKKDRVLKEVVLDLIPWQKASRDIKDGDGEVIVKKAASSRRPPSASCSPRASTRSKSTRKSSSTASSPTTSWTRRPAKSWPRRTRSSRPTSTTRSRSAASRASRSSSWTASNVTSALRDV